MKGFAIAVLAVTLLLEGSGAMELTKENWDGAVVGKAVFIKFQAPWCGHCKSMKPDWDKLTAEYKGSATVLVGDVDCTGDGESLCNQVGVQGYPSIKHGDPNEMQDYKGDRNYAAMKSFAESLGPTCGPANVDLCDDEKKAQVAEFRKLGAAEREALIEEKEKEQEKLEADFKAFTDGLGVQFRAAQEAKEKAVEEVQKSGLGILKAVQASSRKQKKPVRDDEF